MTFPDLLSNDARLVEEAIRRVSKVAPFPELHRAKLHQALHGEVIRGRRDLFSLVRVGRRIVDEG